MKFSLKKTLLWFLPGFILWLALSWVNANMFYKGLMQGLFPIDKDAILIPITTFSFLAAVGIGIITFLVFGFVFLIKRLFPKHYVVTSLGILVVASIPTVFLFQNFLSKRNLKFISEDLGVVFPSNTQVLKFIQPYRFELNEYNCSILKTDQITMGSVGSKLASDKKWIPFTEAPETVWMNCLQDTRGYIFRIHTEEKDFKRKKVLIGMNSSQQLVIHAFSYQYLKIP